MHMTNVIIIISREGDVKGEEFLLELLKWKQQSLRGPQRAQ